ncbi:hypothetical protein, partial [Hydrocarboniphaga sp.]|uniref:hypothetical protein n=1 Tax=Hydrocarboniphaga sp. TaxID=2033016 RepID=UPI0026074D42
DAGALLRCKCSRYLRVSLRFAPCIASRLGRPSPPIPMIQRTSAEACAAQIAAIVPKISARCPKALAGYKPLIPGPIEQINLGFDDAPTPISATTALDNC